MNICQGIGRLWYGMRRPCRNPGTYKEGGKHYCYHHVPSVMETRKATKDKRQELEDAISKLESEILNQVSRTDNIQQMNFYKLIKRGQKYKRLVSELDALKTNGKVDG